MGGRSIVLATLCCIATLQSDTRWSDLVKWANQSYLPRKFFGAQWPAGRAQSRQLIRATAANGSSSPFVPRIYPTLSPWYPPELQWHAQQELRPPTYSPYVARQKNWESAQTFGQLSDAVPSQENISEERLAEQKLMLFLHELANTKKHDQRKYLETFALVEDHLQPLNHDPRYRGLYDGLKQLVDTQSRNPLAYAKVVHGAKANLPPEIAKELDAVVAKQAKLALNWLVWGQ